MNVSLSIWNTLHDGEISALALEAPDILRMEILIEYLRNRIVPAGSSFILRLSGFRKLELTDWDHRKGTSDLGEIEDKRVGILSTDSVKMPIDVATTHGWLSLDFDEVTIALENGEPISSEIVLKAAEEYWREFGKRGDFGS